MLRVPRRISLWIISTLVFLATVTSFAESYRALYVWAAHHDLFGLWAGIWPIQIDVFIAVGELTLFVALIDQWKVRARVFPWLVAIGGLAVSIAGNIGHVSGDAWTDRATAAVPPLAAWAALTVGLGVLKRVRTLHPPTIAADDREEAVTPQPQAAAVVQRPTPADSNWGVNEVFGPSTGHHGSIRIPASPAATPAAVPPQQPPVITSDGPVRSVRLESVNGNNHAH